MNIRCLLGFHKWLIYRDCRPERRCKRCDKWERKYYSGCGEYVWEKV